MHGVVGCLLNGFGRCQLAKVLQHALVGHAFDRDLDVTELVDGRQHRVHRLVPVGLGHRGDLHVAAHHGALWLRVVALPH